jgi:hypothetical protein
MQFYGAYDDVQPEAVRGWRGAPGRGKEPMFLGAVALGTNPAAMRSALDRAIRALREKWPDRGGLHKLQHLHFQGQKPEERLVVLRTMAAHMGAQRSPHGCMLIATALPISIFASDARNEAMYIEGTGWLLRELASLLPPGSELKVTLDDPVGNNREKRSRLRSAILNVPQRSWPPGTLALEFGHKEDERLIQWADYVAGAVLQRRLRGNPDPWRIIAGHVREIPTSPLATGSLQRGRR